MGRKEHSVFLIQAMRLRETKNRAWSVTKLVVAVCLIGMLLFLLPDNAVRAEDRHAVKVGIFPLNRYAVQDENGNWRGIEVEFLSILSGYTDWRIQYVSCDSREDALDKLDKQEVDFVGATQLVSRNDEKLLYGDISVGFTFNALISLCDSDYTYLDFKGMKGSRIGICKNYLASSLFFEYLEKNKFTEYELVTFDDVNTMKSALRSHEIDLMASELFDLEHDLKTVAAFAPKPFFFVSNQGNKELVRELDEALSKLNMDYPTLGQEMVADFYNSFNYLSETLTLQEQNYMRSREHLTVGYLKDQYPFSYEKGGVFTGICREMLDRFAEAAGTKLQYVPVTSVQAGADLLGVGDIDILSYYPEELLRELPENISIPRSYASSPYSLITKRTKSVENIKKVAVISSFQNAEEYFDDDVEITYFDSSKTCVDVVSVGTADACVVENYVFKGIRDSSFSYQSMAVFNNLNAEKRIFLAVGATANTELLESIRKLTKEIPDNDVMQYVVTHDADSGYVIERTLFWFVLAASMIAIIVIIFLKLLLDQKQIQNLTSRDSELGIWNTQYFLYKAQQHIKRDYKEQYAVVYLYLSQFRVYSNINGYEASHRILRQTLNTLLGKVLDESTELYARSYGGHFVMLMRVESEEKLKKRLQNARVALVDDLKEIDTSPMPVCFGVGYINEDSPTVRKALSHANLAMDAMKNSIVGKTIIYNRSFEDGMKDNYEKEKILDAASFNRDFVVYYQSKVDIRTKEIVGAEALIRFKDPTEAGAIRTPGFFIDYYEKNGRVRKLDFFVLNEVCRMLRRRLDEGLPVVPVSCNFSRLHFEERNFISQLDLVVTSFDIPKELIEIEVTETALVEGFSNGSSFQCMEEMIARGFRLSVDDFGTGYSSMGILEEIPASVIKLDRSFFRNEKDRERKIVILKNLSRMANELGIMVICEGVEFDDDVALMEEIQVFIAQGFRYSKPESAESFERRLGH